MLVLVGISNDLLPLRYEAADRACQYQSSYRVDPRLQYLRHPIHPGWHAGSERGDAGHEIPLESPHARLDSAEAGANGRANEAAMMPATTNRRIVPILDHLST